MTKTLSNRITKNVIKRLLKGQDYRIEIVNQINEDFLKYVIDFFKRVVNAKLKNKDITIDWYKKEFLSDNLPSDEIAIHSGLNKKTISNMYNSATKEIVIEASKEHYASLYETIESLVNTEKEVDITLTIKFKGVSVDLSVSESLIVINTLAVKRAALRGGLWSTAGKRVEKPLMQTLCKLYGVDEENYKIKLKGKIDDDVDFVREIDFYLCTDGNDYKCEVKLMGKGNPESADAVIARDSKVFVADKLSDKNKKQLDSLNVEWVEMRDTDGFKRFKTVLTNLNIPHTDFNGDMTSKLEEIFKDLFEGKSND